MDKIFKRLNEISDRLVKIKDKGGYGYSLERQKLRKERDKLWQELPEIRLAVDNEDSRVLP